MGGFYFNTKDSRIILPKRNQWMGYTLNFVSPYSYLIISGVILLVILMVIMDKTVK